MAGKPAGVTVRGGPQLERAFARAAVRAEALGDAPRDALEAIADRSRELVPFRSGALHDTIVVDPTPLGGTVGAGSSSVVYAGVIHDGSSIRNIEPVPFLTAALADRRDAVAARYRDEVGDQVKRFDREAP